MKPFNQYIPCRTLQEWTLNKIYKSRPKNKKNQNDEKTKRLELKINFYKPKFPRSKNISKFQKHKQKHKTKEDKIMT